MGKHCVCDPATIEMVLEFDLNVLSNVTRTGTLTVAGTTTSPATSVTVNGYTAARYNDATFASTNSFTVTNGDNTFTAIANDSLGRYATNSITCYLPATNSFTYDLNGNLLSDGYRTFTYDDENELTSIVVSNGVNTPTLISNIYDGKLRLRIRREYTWSSGWQWTTEVHYIYDGNLVIQERDINNLPTVTYTRGVDFSGPLQGGARGGFQQAGGIGSLLARTDFGLWTLGSGLAHAYYHADGNGNVTMLINSSQAIVAKYEYDPYGNVLSLSGSLAAANVYRFSGKEYFLNSGLCSFGRRFYDPNLQRWVNRDPIQERGGINLYAYAMNSPGNWIDSLGLAGTLVGPGAASGVTEAEMAEAEANGTQAIAEGTAMLTAESAGAGFGLGTVAAAGGGIALGVPALGLAGWMAYQWGNQPPSQAIYPSDGPLGNPIPISAQDPYPGPDPHLDRPAPSRLPKEIDPAFAKAQQECIDQIAKYGAACKEQGSPMTRQDKREQYIKCMKDKGFDVE